MRDEQLMSLYPMSESRRVTGDGWSARLCVAHFKALPGSRGMRFLLVHGNPANLDDWTRTVPALRALGEVAVYDQVGFGQSDSLEGREPTLDACADVALALVDALGWQRFVLVGQSHGAMVAHTVAARAPERVESVVLVASGGIPVHGSYRLLAMPGVHEALRRLGAPLFRRPALRPLARLATSLALRRAYEPDSVPEGLLNAQMRAFERRPELLDAMAALAQHGPCQQLARQGVAVRAPVLFIHGRHDRLVPIACARGLFAATARHERSAFRAMDGGHMLHACRAHEVNPVMLAWLNGAA